MKMMMHIDEALLEKVMESYGLETKTSAYALSCTKASHSAFLPKMLNIFRQIF